MRTDFLHFFSDKVIWITGASSGIGKALAQALAPTGCRMILSSPHLDKLESVKSVCSGPDKNIYLLPVDLTENHTLTEVSQQAIQAFGHIDILLNNAGIALRDLVINTHPEVDRKIMEVNYFGTVALTKAVLPHMLERGSGRIAAVTSVSGLYGIPKGAAYSASKHAEHGFFDSLRQEIHDSGVGVTLLVPGIIDTEITVHALKGDGEKLGKKLKVHDEGYDVDECALDILEALEKGKDEAVIGKASDKFSVGFWRFFPGWFYKVLQNHPIKRLRKWRAKWGSK